MAAPFVCFVITQPSMPLKLYGTVKRTRVVLLCTRNVPHCSTGCLFRVSQSS